VLAILLAPEDLTLFLFYRIDSHRSLTDDKLVKHHQNVLKEFWQDKTFYNEITPIYSDYFKKIRKVPEIMRFFLAHGQGEQGMRAGKSHLTLFLDLLIVVLPHGLSVWQWLGV